MKKAQENPELCNSCLGLTILRSDRTPLAYLTGQGNFFPQYPASKKCRDAEAVSTGDWDFCANGNRVRVRLDGVRNYFDGEISDPCNAQYLCTLLSARLGGCTGNDTTTAAFEARVFGSTLDHMNPRELNACKNDQEEDG